MDAEEAVQSEELIQGTCEVNSRTLNVLYDLGATHSFISRNCVTTLQLPVFEMPSDLLVSTPTNKPIRTSQVCLNIPFQIEGRTFVANLICLPSCAGFLPTMSC